MTPFLQIATSTQRVYNVCVYTDVYMGMYKLYLHEHWNSMEGQYPPNYLQFITKRKKLKEMGVRRLLFLLWLFLNYLNYYNENYFLNSNEVRKNYNGRNLKTKSWVNKAKTFLDLQKATHIFMSVLLRLTLDPISTELPQFYPYSQFLKVLRAGF